MIQYGHFIRVKVLERLVLKHIQTCLLYTSYQLQRRAYCYLCQQKPDEMPQGKFRPLQFTEAGCRAEYTHCKKQHQQTIAKAYQCVVDADNDCPDLAAAKALRRLRNK